MEIILVLMGRKTRNTQGKWNKNINRNVRRNLRGVYIIIIIL